MPSPSLPISRHISPSSRYQELLVVPSSTIKQPAAVDFFDERRWRALEADSLPVSPPVSPMHLPCISPYLPVSPHISPCISPYLAARAGRGP